MKFLKLDKYKNIYKKISYLSRPQSNEFDLGK